MTKTYDVIGYATADCDMVCPACLTSGDRGAQPVFADTEFDAPEHCSRCGTLIPVALTAHGIMYVLWAVASDFAKGHQSVAVTDWWPAYEEEITQAIYSLASRE